MPGQTETVEYEFTFDATSWDRREDIRIIVWTQQPASLGPAEVYQSELISWPLLPLGGCGADITGDEVVDCSYDNSDWV